MVTNSDYCALRIVPSSWFGICNGASAETYYDLQYNLQSMDILVT